MQFKLIENGNSVRKHDRDILKQVIYNLIEDDDCFIILEPKQPIDNSIYLQVSLDQNKYKIEIRLIFSSDDDFKHYSLLCANKEEVYQLFDNYYSSSKLPDLRHWTDETSTFKEEEERDMVKLYKDINGTTHYFEMWIDEEDTLTSHEGILGDIGETETYSDESENDYLPPRIAMAKAIKTYEDNGYAERLNLTELIVQYPIENNNNPLAAQEQLEAVEACLNNCLGWTGNGHCDGGDIAYNIATFFCYVVNKDIASETIVDALEQDNFILAGLKIAYADEKTEEFQLIYPNAGTFNLI